MHCSNKTYSNVLWKTFRLDDLPVVSARLSIQVSESHVSFCVRIGNWLLRSCSLLVHFVFFYVVALDYLVSVVSYFSFSSYSFLTFFVFCSIYLWLMLELCRAKKLESVPTLVSGRKAEQPTFIFSGCGLTLWLILPVGEGDCDDP